MDNKRKFNRWNLPEEKAYINLEGKKEEIQILDISIGGMRAVTTSPVDKNQMVTGEFKILPNIGSFFVRGKVVWVARKDNNFETGIEFDKVSTIPIPA